MINSCLELAIWRFERVFRREVDVEEKDTALIGRARGTQDGGDPLVEIVALGPSAAVGGRVQRDLAQLLLDPLGGSAQRLRHLRRPLLSLSLVWRVIVCPRTASPLP